MSKGKQQIPLSEVRLNGGAHRAERPCAHPECDLLGEYRAPRSRGQLDCYYWFCLEHVRAYNAAWDFFRGMNETEIQRFQRESVTGHRPTWPMGAAAAAWSDGRIRDDFEIFGARAANGHDGEAPQPPLEPRRRRALSELELEPGASLQEIKMRYKQLVKRFHPDVNGGDKGLEERFKAINEAYSYLMSSGPA